MPDLRTQLRAYVAETIERVDMEDVVAAASPPVGRPGVWRRPVVVFAVAAVFVLLAIGASTLILQGGTDDPATEPTVTTVTTVPDTTTIPPTTSASTSTTVAGLESGSWTIPLDQIDPLRGMPQDQRTPLLSWMDHNRSWISAVDVTAVSDDRVWIGGSLYGVVDGELRALGPKATDSDGSATRVLEVDGDGYAWAYSGDGAFLRISDKGDTERVEPPVLPDRGDGIERPLTKLKFAPDGTPWLSMSTSRCADAFRYEGDSWTPALTCEQIPLNDEGVVVNARIALGDAGVVWVANVLQEEWMLHRIDGATVDSYPFGSPSPTWGDIDVDADGRVWVWGHSPFRSFFHDGEWVSQGPIRVYLAPDGVWGVTLDPSVLLDPTRPTPLTIPNYQTLTHPAIFRFDGQAWRLLPGSEGSCRINCSIDVARDGTVWIADIDEQVVTIARFRDVDDP